MLKNLANWVVSRLDPPPERKKIIVFIDGDQVNSRKLVNTLCKQKDGVEYIWVKRPHCQTPSAVANNSLIQVRSAQKFVHCGDPVDMYIALQVSTLCATDRTIREIIILSNDTDYIDVLNFVSHLYPEIRFFNGVFRDGPSYKHVLVKTTLPPNCTRLVYRLKTSQPS